MGGMFYIIILFIIFYKINLDSEPSGCFLTLNSLLFSSENPSLIYKHVIKYSN